MRILQVHTRYRNPGGEDGVVAAEAAVLRSAGHDVIEYQLQNPSGPVRSAGALALSPWNPLAVRTLLDLVRATHPEVAHVHNTWYAMSPAAVRGLRRAGVPVVVTLHNFRLACANALLFRDGAPCEDCVGSHPFHGIRHRCYRGSILASTSAAMTIALHRRVRTWTHEVDLYLALNEFARARFVRSGLPPERTWVKPNFVDDPGSRLQPVSRSRVVLYAGRLSPEKGVGVLLEAWARHHDTGLELQILGDGPLRSDLERTAPASVRFAGRLGPDEVRARMLSARALVLPSIWYEGQPLVVLEALAAGLPVLGSALGGLTELLRPLGQNWLAAPGDTDCWAEALGILRDADGLEAASGRSRALYEERFTPASGLVALESAYGLVTTGCSPDH